VLPCVILAGGLGTRLQSLHPDVPKTMVPVAGRPFAAWQLDWLAAQGVTEVVYCLGHLGDQVRAYVGDGSPWGLAVHYVEEGDDLRGTAGAVRGAVEAGVLGPAFFVLYGDSYLSVDLADVEREFGRSRGPALMTVLRNDGRWDASNAVVAGGRVVRYEKGLADPPPDMSFIDYGLSVLSRDVVTELVPPGVACDLADVFATLSRRGVLAGYEVAARFYEIGSPAGLADLADHLTRRGS
jgi:NDP-sugar pyrophosphorylase family protein